MRSMTEEDLLDLLESLGVEAAKEIRESVANLDVQASLATTSLKGALRDMQKGTATPTRGVARGKTILTAAARDDGDKPPTTVVTGKRKADFLGVRQETSYSTRQRAQQFDTELRLDDAIAAGTYWYQPRTERIDATSSPELLELMRQYWHTDEVSGATGNSAERDTWKSSEAPGAESHPRRQLTEAGGGVAVYAKFLRSAAYGIFKAQQGSNFTDDPGRALFLSTRCKCLTLPVVEQ